jgi:ATP-dependent Lhr-like helicase
MSSPPSSSDLQAAYESLHPKVKQWIWEQGWTEIRQAQAMAIPPILEGRRDVIISAATASGKTEAAWLPICSSIAEFSDSHPPTPGVKALYVSPLKALINDQHSRLTGLCEAIDIPINRRHGDVTGKERQALRIAPDGALLITPESLEALFVLQGTHAATIFAGLRYVVIDEMHSFIGTERGAQLQSLLHRVDLAVRRRTPRIGLSATFSDFSIAQDFLRPRAGNSVVVIASTGERSDLKMQVRGYLATDSTTDGTRDQIAPEVIHASDKHAIADHLFRTLRGADNLVFANSRTNVEAFSDLLQRRSNAERIPNEFFPHHGNLSKAIREDVEKRLLNTETNTTAICTSTLEMGVDIGTTDSVAQIGPPYSVAAIRQRVGRSGRRDKEAILRTYVSERPLDGSSHVIDRLRTDLVQTIAVMELMLEKWYEPPSVSNLHLSTLIQQILSMTAQHGGVSAGQLFNALCGEGPFQKVDKAMFTSLLRRLGETEILIQSGDGLLLPGKTGDALVNHYTFFAAFKSAQEYRLITSGQVLGTIPIDYPLLVDSMMIFAGRRWRVIGIDSATRTVELTPATGGKAPPFSGTPREISDGIRKRMHQLYESTDVPVYLDERARDLLAEARSSYKQHQLTDVSVVDYGTDSVVVAWRGSRIINTIAVLLLSQGIDATIEGPGLTCSHLPVPDLLAALARLLETPPPDPVSLASHVPNKATEKNDEYLDEPLLAAAYASSSLDVPAAWEVIERIVAIHPVPVLDQSDQLGGPLHEDALPALIGTTGFAVVDVETTALAASRHGRVIEVGIVLLDPDGIQEERWTTVINPQGPVGRLDIHGLTTDDIQDAPHFGDVLDEIAYLMSDRIVVAHNAAFDIAFLNREFIHAGARAPIWPTMCTLRIARELERSEPSSLAAVAARLGVGARPAHHALADAETAAGIVHALLHDPTAVSELQRFVTPDRVPEPWPPPIQHSKARPRG